jgi:iron complex transport system ATP-binding protein
MLLKAQIRQAGYGDHAILQDIRFDLPEGRILAVIGPNGCGKTTLIRALSAVLPDIRGSLHINGTDILAAEPSARARLIAVVPQSTQVPPIFSVEEMVLLGRSPHLDWLGRTSSLDMDVVSEAMQQCDIYEYRTRLCGELSAGERQRVILARALAQATPVLLMDEPTAHLDLRYQIEFLELTAFLASQHGKTILVALHDLNLAARFGDVVMAIKSGSMAAMGSANEILNPDLLSGIYGLPVQVFPSPDGRQTVVIPS